MFGFDQYYVILVLPAILLATFAQIMVKTTFGKYNSQPSARGLTGAQVARQILDDHGLYNVAVERVSGQLTDHYDPSANVVRLSDSVYSSTSIGAIGVAAHETGHAVQHSAGYIPVKIRTAIIPVTNIGSSLSVPLIFAGVIFSIEQLITLGILLFATVAVFQLVTLPVEFNASSRALKTLESRNILYDDEMNGAKRVLSAAAMTYVAALIVTAAQLLRLVLLYGGRRRDD
ncbi:MAG TPA: peptidase [Ruminococcaceae bacterium]|nr:peptidase [Oscillospiraceae bacterium]